tara:strand:+ start:809 stop:985 length:177 start_codon:yes stop_codon:yes gene_type:complete
VRKMSRGLAIQLAKARKEISRLLQERERFIEIVGQQRIYINTLTATMAEYENQKEVKE